jgi:DNA-binding transcriptional regulator GbsR (MarR family)
LRVQDALKQRPLCTLQEAARRSGLSFPSVGTAMEQLARLKIVREITGKKRNRVYAYERYLKHLSEGTEPA